MSGISAINENTNSRFDNDEYKPDGGNVDVAPRGSKNQQTERNAGLEDRETADSDVTGKIPRREIDDLRANHFEGETDLPSGTRGVKVDAYKQERDVDKFLDEQGITDAEQDVEIGRATG